MSATMAVAGAFGGAMLCATAGTIGARAVLGAAGSEQQRAVLRQILTWGGIYASAVMGVVLLAAFQVLSAWIYAVALALWFGPLWPALGWAHRRLDALADRAGCAALTAAA